MLSSAAAAASQASDGLLWGLASSRLLLTGPPDDDGEDADAVLGTEHGAWKLDANVEDIELLGTAAAAAEPRRRPDSWMPRFLESLLSMRACPGSL